jgi:hypothetical protein
VPEQILDRDVLNLAAVEVYPWSGTGKRFAEIVIDDMHVTLSTLYAAWNFSPVIFGTGTGGGKCRDCG